MGFPLELDHLRISVADLARSRDWCGPIAPGQCAPWLQVASVDERLAREADACVGVYAAVAVPGTTARGDAVALAG